MARRNSPDALADACEQVEGAAEEREEIDPRVRNTEDFLPTGSALLNLALSDIVNGGYALGTMANVIGDSSSGKTFLALTSFAEAARLSRFDDYRFIYDDAEAACAFDIPYLFGQRVADRIEAPCNNEDNPASSTVQEFSDNIHNAIDEGKPFIYILDSLDALSSEEEVEKAEDNRKARAAGKEVKGSYGMTKAKGMSEMFRLIIRRLKSTNSILIVISQTRDNVDPMSFSKKTRSGGRALKFYASHEAWVAVGKTHKKRERVIGLDAIIKTTKNKITGKRREVELPIFYDYGIDDIGSCIDFLVEEKVWTKSANTIQAKGVDLVGTRDKLIRTIEGDRKLERALRACVGQAWHDIEESLRLGRKPKYE